MSPQIDQLIFFITLTTVVIFLLAGLIILILYLYQKRLLGYMDNMKKVMLDNERNLLKSQVEIQEQTFLDISKEIHDNISLSLTLAKLNLNTINWKDTRKIFKSTNASIEILTKAIGDLNNLSRSMNSDIIKNMGLHKAIRAEIEKLEQASRIEVELRIEGEPVFIDCEKELVLFRIFQEGINNILKHANASRVNLVLNYETENLIASIEDNGAGFIYDAKGTPDKVHSGIINMINRAKTIGSELALESMLGKGTSILITVPY